MPPLKKMGAVSLELVPVFVTELTTKRNTEARERKG